MVIFNENIYFCCQKISAKQKKPMLYCIGFAFMCYVLLAKRNLN